MFKFDQTNVLFFKEKRPHLLIFSVYSCVHLRYVNIDIWKSENNGSIEKQQQNHCGCILDCKSVSVPELPTVLNLSLPFLSTEFDFPPPLPLSNMWISHSGTTCLRLIKKIGLRKRTNKPAACAMHSDLMQSRFD